MFKTEDCDAEYSLRPGVLLFGEHSVVKDLNELDIFKIEISLKLRSI